MSDADALGNLTVRYAENERHIACLHSTLDHLGANLERLGHDLKDFPDGITVTDNGFELEQDEPIALADCSIEKVVSLVGDLVKATKEKVRLEDSLDRAGLNNIIKSRPLKTKEAAKVRHPRFEVRPPSQ